MTSPSISSVTASDWQRAISTIVTAFSSDPIARWVFPEPHQYLTYFTEFVPLMAGGSFEHGSAYCTDDFMAASLWLPPDGAALVSTPHRRGPGPPGKGSGLGAAQARAQELRPRPPARLSRGDQPEQPPPLRTSRLRGHRRNPGRGLAYDVADAPRAPLTTA